MPLGEVQFLGRVGEMVGQLGGGEPIELVFQKFSVDGQIASRRKKSGLPDGLYFKKIRLRQRLGFYFKKKKSSKKDGQKTAHRSIFAVKVDF